MTIIPTSYIDAAENILKPWPLPDVLWRGECTRIVRKWVDGNECFALLSNKNDEVLAHAAYFCPSTGDNRPCWAGIVQDVKRPHACILGKLLMKAEDIDSQLAWA